MESALQRIRSLSAKPSSAAVTEPEGLAVSPRRIKVLIVDDDPASLLATHSVLEPLGAEIITTASGREALKLLLERHFAAVLLNVRMPDADGFEIAMMIRERPQSRATPILFLSGEADEELLERAYGLGAVDYLQKPVMAFIVRAKVAGFIELARQTEMLRQQTDEIQSLNAELQQRGEDHLQLHTRMLESMTEGVSITDEAGVILYTNPAEEKMLGYEPGELVGQHLTIQNAYIPEENERIVEEIISELKTKSSWRGELQNKKKDGSEFYTNSRITPVELSGRRYWVCVQEDITERKRAEAALRVSEERFRRALEIGTVGVIFFDPGGEITKANEAFLRMGGYTEDDVRAGRLRWDTLTPPEWMPASLQAIEQLRTVGTTVPYEKEYFRKDGTRWMGLFAAKKLSENEGVEFILEVTERKRLEEELSAERTRLERVFLQAPVAIVVFRGKDYRIELANPFFQNLLEGRELMGRPFAEVVPELGREVWDGFRSVMTTGKPFLANDLYVRYDQDGDGVIEDHWFNVVYNPLREDTEEVVGIIAVSHEVTAQVLARKELERANHDLEEFAYVSSHDLQEPLRMVNAYSELLLRECLTQHEKPQLYAKFIREGVSRMEALIRDLLSYSKTVHDPDRASAGVADLNDSLAQALDILKPQIQETGAAIAASHLPSVQGDTSQLAHVFQNLISNALKYRKGGAPPVIDVIAEDQGDEWVISVADNGIGFDQQHATRIFGLFKRLHKNEYPGTGLGLAICHRIVERYGGRIWAESEPGTGSRFFFSLSKAVPR